MSSDRRQVAHSRMIWYRVPLYGLP